MLDGAFRLRTVWCKGLAKWTKRLSLSTVSVTFLKNVGKDRKVGEGADHWMTRLLVPGDGNVILWV